MKINATDMSEVLFHTETVWGAPEGRAVLNNQTPFNFIYSHIVF